MLLDTCKSASRPRFICVLWLSNSRVGHPEVPDNEEDSQAISDHGQGTPRSHPLLDVKEFTCPVACPVNKCFPVGVAIKWKPHTTGSLVAHRQYYNCEVFLIKRIARTNEEKLSVLLLGVLLPQEPHCMNPPHPPAPSVLSSNPLQIFPVLQASLDSDPVTPNTCFASIC